MTTALVVDDSALMRRLVGAVLREAGFTVAVARDGEDALSQLHTVRPDVVTLDVQMPRLDGLACLDRIMLERPCPVVMLSSLTEAGAATTLEALALGAVDFMAKPGGAVSLTLDEWGPALVQKVRHAAALRPRRAARLAERVRLRMRAAAPAEAAVPAYALAPDQPARRPRAERPAETIVLVGTSTGGPPALDALLAPLPADFPWPILVAQHMPSRFTAALASRLDRLCALRVVEAAAPVPVLPGQVVIGQGDADMILVMRDGHLTAMPDPASAAHRWHPSVDRLVASAMACCKPEGLVGVLMTGMGDDGAAAMAALHRAGGRTVAEAEESAVVWGMPGALVRAGGASAVARLDMIAALLRDWAA